jgi:hypothetical protein
MPEAVGGALELDGDEGLPLARPVKPTSTADDRVDHRLTDEEGEELVQDQPLVVPGDQPPRLAVHLGGVRGATGAQPVDPVVVELQEGRLEPANNNILVVARVGDDRGPVRQPRQILEQAARLDLRLRPVGLVVQVR